MVLSKQFPIDSIAKLFTISSEIVDRQYVLISFSFEKRSSPDVTVASIVK